MSRFESARSLEVWALDPGRDTLERIGRTPTHDGEGVAVPDDRPWGVDLRVLPHVDDDAVRRLLEELRAARVPGLRLEKVDDAWLRRLAGLELTALVVEDASAITDAGLAAIADIGSLRLLDLAKPREITDAGLKRLVGLPALHTLRFNDPRAVTPKGAQLLREMSALRRLRWGGVRLADEALVAIGELEKLEALDLSFSRVSDAGLARVARLGGLRALDLTATRVTDAGTEALTGLARLERLDLRECEVGDDGLAALGKLPALADLDLCDTAVLDEGLAKLAGAGALRALRLARCALRGDGLPALAELPSLALVELTACRLVADEGLKDLPRLQALEEVGVAHCRGTLPEKGGVTDATVVQLAELPRLRRVDLTGCWVTPMGLRALRAARPGCRVIADERGMGAEIAQWLTEAEELRERGEADDARTLLRRATAEDPESVEAWTELGDVCAEIGDTAGAEEALGKAIELADDAPAHQARAAVRVRLGNPTGALLDLSAALARDPESGESYAARGDLRFDSGDRAGAVQDYSHALALLCAGKGPAKVWLSVAPMLFVNRAAARLELGQAEPALRDCDRAIAIEPSSAIAWTNRGEAKLRRKDAAGALADYDQALRLDPDGVDSHLGRGRALAALGRRDQAAAELARFLELAPEHPDRLDAERELKQLLGE